MRQLLRTAIPPFYQTLDFWILFVLAVIGTLYSIRAFTEAGHAKDAASAAKDAAAAAGRSVKIQTVTIELTEILQRLDKLDAEITFPQARDLLSEVSRRLRRLIGPFSDVPEIAPHYEQLKDALRQAKEALEGVRPTSLETAKETPNAVYYALQGHFATISEVVAEISGALERQTMDAPQNA
jgi:hypothetical protein